MQNKIIGLLVLTLGGLFMAGCASNSAITHVNQPDRTLVVVPVKGQPIVVHSLHLASFLAGGVVGTMIEQQSTASAAERLGTRLNQDASFNGERMLAEECANLLKTSPKVSFREVTVAPQDGELPGVKNFAAGEQQRFKAYDNSRNISQWDDIFSAWKKSPPVAGNITAAGQRAVYLEVTFKLVFLKNGKTIEPAYIYMRLVDAVTGEALALSDFFVTYSMSKVTSSSDLRVFESDFRQCMVKAARYGLKDLNLL